MKFYRDEDGNLYSVDRETGEKTLIEKGSVSDPDTDEKDEDE